MITLMVPDKTKSPIGTKILIKVAYKGLDLVIDEVKPKKPRKAATKERAIESNKKYNAIISFKFEKYRLIPNIRMINKTRAPTVYTIFETA
jgi:hypothetical protein